MGEHSACDDRIRELEAEVTRLRSLVSLVLIGEEYPPDRWEVGDDRG